MINNPAKAKFLQNTRRFYKHTHLCRQLHGLIREFAPYYGSAGRELETLVLQYESLVGKTSDAATKALPQLSSQLHEKLYQLLPRLGSERKELMKVMTELETLYPHLYPQPELSEVKLINYS